tara:strand:- start:1340 stop:2068 length:729 start_codon:yes stop_codon:yes gene_type:complete
MALPKLNESAKYELTVPSTQEIIHFRPYLVKEEKILMHALETGTTSDQVNAVLNTVRVCIDEDIDLENLPSFDLDYLFLKLRAKSVGEISKINFKCNNNECLKQNGPIDVNLQDIEVQNLDRKSKMIELSEDVSIELGAPTYNDLKKLDLKDGDNIETTENIFKMISACIKSIITPDEKILSKDCSEKELNDFVESMSSSQFTKISSYVDNLPELSTTIKFTCVSCNKENEQVIRGLQNFFA